MFICMHTSANRHRTFLHTELHCKPTIDSLTDCNLLNLQVLAVTCRAVHHEEVTHMMGGRNATFNSSIFALRTS